MKSARLRQGAALLLALGMLAMAAGCGAVQTGRKAGKDGTVADDAGNDAASRLAG